jgi:assimilatory nitrate reductase catalytic subunit
MVAEVAKRLGFAQAFPDSSAADVFREHAALSAFENGGRRDFDIGGVASVTNDAFDALEPFQWPLRAGEARIERRFFADGGFFTPDRKAIFVVPKSPAPRMATTPDYPFRLNTGRVRDQWHTMTRTGMSPRLGVHLPEPFVEVHPSDALRLGLVHSGFARVTTPFGACVLKVVVSGGQRPGSVFVPIHWSDETSSRARICELVTPETDPVSGQPEAKATPAAIAPVTFAFRGFALTRQPIGPPADAWWARIAVGGGAGLLFATNESTSVWHRRLETYFPGAEIAEYADIPRGVLRAAAFVEGRLHGCLFVEPAVPGPQWDIVKALFESEAIADMQRRMLLSGKSADGLGDSGPVVCACFSVGLNVIRDSILSNAVASVDDIGKALRAGTNCGSCVPELKRIIHEHAAQTV